MTTSAAFMALNGIAASFLPQEILAVSASGCGFIPVLVVQIAGALYLGFAVVNWMARGVLIGGIYARPLALGNFMHFGVGAITLAKVLATNFWLPAAILLLPYAALAGWFGTVLFASPVANRHGDS